MSRHEVLSPEGLRIDGRRWNDLRHLTTTLSPHPASDGSSHLTIGQTQIICTVTGPCEKGVLSSSTPHASTSHPIPTSTSELDSGDIGSYAPLNPKNPAPDITVLAEITIAPFAAVTGPRNKLAKSDRRVAEMQRFLARVLYAVVAPAAHTGIAKAGAEILVSCRVLASDGGVLAACVNAACAAVIEAGIGVEEYVVACTAGAVSLEPSFGGAGMWEGEAAGEVVVDVNAEEERELACVTVACIGDGGERVVGLMLEDKVRVERLDGLLAVAVDGCQEVRKSLDRAVRKWGMQVVREREEMGWFGA